LLSDRKALLISTEVWVKDEWFRSLEHSIYFVENSIDVQNIDRADGEYDWVMLNHVLEHVEDDSAAIRELVRILSDRGVLQITVPGPHLHFETEDWGYPDPNNSEHYREYGSDFTLKVIAESKSPCFVVLGEDSLTSTRDWVYFVFKSEAVMTEFANLYCSQKVSVLRLA
jgi:ubiquinone/menaquinone biosynthesis C-methylase UbiE